MIRVVRDVSAGRSRAAGCLPRAGEPGVRLRADNDLDHKYSNSELRNALDNLPTDSDEYGPAARSSAGASTRLGQGRRRPSDGPGRRTAVGQGAGRDAPRTARTWQRSPVTRRRPVAPSVKVGGETVTPGKNGLFDLASASNGLPVPLLAARSRSPSRSSAASSRCARIPPSRASRCCPDPGAGVSVSPTLVRSRADPFTLLASLRCPRRRPGGRRLRCRWRQRADPHDDRRGPDGAGRRCGRGRRDPLGPPRPGLRRVGACSLFAALLRSQRCRSLGDRAGPRLHRGGPDARLPRHLRRRGRRRAAGAARHAVVDQRHRARGDGGGACTRSPRACGRGRSARTRSPTGSASRSSTGTPSARPRRWRCRACCGWAPAAPAARRGRVLAYPAIGAAVVAILLTQSRGALAGRRVGTVAWLAIVPLRLRMPAGDPLPPIGGGGVAAWALRRTPSRSRSSRSPSRRAVAASSAPCSC